MHVTVVLCTYNRCDSLAKALRSVAKSVVHSSVQWEVLVVDNNSRDNTRAMVERFCLEFPGRFRYIFEPQQGKSYALNSGIRQSRGDILAFTFTDAGFLTHQSTLSRIGTGNRRRRSFLLRQPTPAAENYFFLPAIAFAGPLRVRALVWVR